MPVSGRVRRILRVGRRVCLSVNFLVVNLALKARLRPWRTIIRMVPTAMERVEAGKTPQLIRVAANYFCFLQRGEPGLALPRAVTGGPSLP